VKSKIVHLADSPASICSLQPAREGWEEAFRATAASEDDKLILNDAVRTRRDEEEWRQSGDCGGSERKK
jgi:hypothetical protein